MAARGHRGRRTLDLTGGIAAMCWVSNLTAFLFPTTRAVDPPSTAVFPQLEVALASLALAGTGYVLERRRLGSLPRA